MSRMKNELEMELWSPSRPWSMATLLEEDSTRLHFTQHGLLSLLPTISPFRTTLTPNFPGCERWWRLWLLGTSILLVRLRAWTPTKSVKREKV